MSAGHSETLSKHLTGVLYVGQKNILFCLFFFFLGHFREDICFGEIIYLERPCLKPTPPCSAAVSGIPEVGSGIPEAGSGIPEVVVGVSEVGSCAAGEPL